jgi:hypothetical protein
MSFGWPASCGPCGMAVLSEKWLHARQTQRNNARLPPPVDIALAKFGRSQPGTRTGACASTKRPRTARHCHPRRTRPSSPEVQGLFQQLEVDPLYAMLCHQQQCFRARVSGKPWRMGLNGLSGQERRWPACRLSRLHASSGCRTMRQDRHSSRPAALSISWAATLCSAAQTFVSGTMNAARRTLWHWPEHLRDHSQSLLLETGV